MPPSVVEKATASATLSLFSMAPRMFSVVDLPAPGCAEETAWPFLQPVLFPGEPDIDSIADGRTQTPHPSEAVLRFRHHRHLPCSAKRLDHDHPHRDRSLCLRRTAPPHRAAYANAIAIGNSAAASGITASPVARSTHSWRRGKQVAPPSTRIRRASTESRGRRNVGRGR